MILKMSPRQGALTFCWSDPKIGEGGGRESKTDEGAREARLTSEHSHDCSHSDPSFLPLCLR